MSYYSSVILADNPVAYWRLNEVSGTNGDDSAASDLDVTFNVDLASPPSIIQTGGQPGATIDGDYSVYFGSTQFATVPAASAGPLHFALPVSVEAWVRRHPGDPLQTSAVFTEDFTEGSNIRYVMGINDPTANRITFGFYTGGWKRVVDASDLPDDGDFHHMVGTYDGANLRIYRDGVLTNTLAETTALPAGAGNFYIGRRWDANDVAKMDIDEVAIYNVKLTDAQVLNHYNAAFILSAGGNKGRGGGAAGSTGNRGGHAKPPKPPKPGKPPKPPHGTPPPPSPPSVESHNSLYREPPQRRYIGSGARTPIRSLP